MHDFRLLMCSTALTLLFTGCESKDRHVLFVESPKAPPLEGSFHCLATKHPPVERCAELARRLIAELAAQDRPDHIYCTWAIDAGRVFGQNTSSLEVKCCIQKNVRETCDQKGVAMCPGARCTHREIYP